jgi:hypothetical protein
MCRNGRYTERGIKQRDGYASDFYRIEPEFAVKSDAKLGCCGVLLEPASATRLTMDPWLGYPAAHASAGGPRAGRAVNRRGGRGGGGRGGG